MSTINSFLVFSRLIILLCIFLVSCLIFCWGIWDGWFSIFVEYYWLNIKHNTDLTWNVLFLLKKKDCESAVSWYQRLCIEIHVFSRVCRSVCSWGESSCDHCLYLDLASVPDPSPDRDLLVPTPAPRHVQTCSLKIQRSPLDMLKLVHLDLTIQGIPPAPPHTQGQAGKRAGWHSTVIPSCTISRSNAVSSIPIQGSDAEVVLLRVLYVWRCIRNVLSSHESAPEWYSVCK